MSVPRFRSVSGLALVLLALAACTGGEVADPTSTSITATPTTTPASSTSTTEADVGLDLSEWWWVTNGPDGIRLGGVEPFWPTQPFPAGIARDRQGGFAFIDSTGLWWFRSNHLEPSLIAQGVAELIAVATTDDGPVAMVWEDGPAFIRLSDGETVAAPADAPVEIAPDDPWSRTWTAANGLSAWVTEPDVVTDTEGQPEEIRDPSHLVVARGEQVLFDMVIGGVYEEWARIHDFDGQRVIVSRGPYEPAMGDETFFLIDLAEGAVTSSFIAGGTQATLTRADSDWSGPVVTPDLGFYAGSAMATDAGVEDLLDGRHLVFIMGTSGQGSALQLDLAVWFSGGAANTAAMLDGETEIPVPNDYYIRNEDPSVLSVSVADDVAVTSVWYDYDTDPDLQNDPITYSELLDVVDGDGEGTQVYLRTSPWWVTVEHGEIVALDEQYLP